MTYREAMLQARREYLTALLIECDGSLKRAAQVSRVHRATLHRLMLQTGAVNPNPDPRGRRVDWS